MEPGSRTSGCGESQTIGALSRSGSREPTPQRLGREPGDVSSLLAFIPERLGREGGDVRSLLASIPERLGREGGDARSLLASIPERLGREGGDARSLLAFTPKRLGREPGDPSRSCCDCNWEFDSDWLGVSGRGVWAVDLGEVVNDLVVWDDRSERCELCGDDGRRIAGECEMRAAGDTAMVTVVSIAPGLLVCTWFW